VKDASSKLRAATRRAKSDVANKLVSMFLHELSRRISRNWEIRVDGEAYRGLVRQWFENRCPYCLRDLADSSYVVEHLDGMNRYRAGLHVPGNVIVACKTCNGEKRRDDSLKVLTLGQLGWESFLSHNDTQCDIKCRTCLYWKSIWQDDAERLSRLAENLSRIRDFRASFPDFAGILPVMHRLSPELLTRLYSDCQEFANREIRLLLDRIEPTLDSSPAGAAGPTIRS
jgi:hypothetical protein